MPVSSGNPASFFLANHGEKWSGRDGVAQGTGRDPRPHSTLSGRNNPTFDPGDWCRKPTAATTRYAAAEIAPDAGRPVLMLSGGTAAWNMDPISAMPQMVDMFASGSCNIQSAAYSHLGARGRNALGVGTKVSALGDSNSAIALRVNTNDIFQMISIGGQVACGVTATGAVDCWGSNLTDQLDSAFVPDTCHFLSSLPPSPANAFPCALSPSRVTLPATTAAEWYPSHRTIMFALCSTHLRLVVGASSNPTFWARTNPAFRSCRRFVISTMEARALVHGRRFWRASKTPRRSRWDSTSPAPRLAL
jgi:hypothetical protein